MADFAARSFTDETIQIDGNGYLDCEFLRCRLTYSGGDVPRFDGMCHFADCRWHFEGPAGNTLAFFRNIIASGGDVRVLLLEALGMVPSGGA